MFWCLQGGNCLNRGFSRIIRISRILARVRKNRLNQDLQDARICRIKDHVLSNPRMCVENRSQHSLEPQRGDIRYRLNHGFSRIKRIEESIIVSSTNLSHLRLAGCH